MMTTPMATPLLEPNLAVVLSEPLFHLPYPFELNEEEAEIAATFSPFANWKRMPTEDEFNEITERTLNNGYYLSVDGNKLHRANAL